MSGSRDAHYHLEASVHVRQFNADGILSGTVKNPGYPLGQHTVQQCRFTASSLRRLPCERFPIGRLGRGSIQGYDYGSLPAEKIAFSIFNADPEQAAGRMGSYRKGEARTGISARAKVAPHFFCKFTLAPVCQTGMPQPCRITWIP